MSQFASAGLLLQNHLAPVQPRQASMGRVQASTRFAGRPAPGYRNAMAAYRIYFRGATTIIGREDFEADDDSGAMAVGWLLWDACSDLASSFELWQGDRELCERRGPLRAALSAIEVTERMQASVVATEEAIQRSKWAIAQSRRLLGQLAQARRNRRGLPD